MIFRVPASLFKTLAEKKLNEKNMKKSSLFIITAFILILSINSNAQWVQMNNGIGLDKYIYSITASGNNIYAGTNTGIYLSTNNGTSWTQNGLNNQYVLSLATLGNNIFAGTDINGIYLSTNNGSNWTQTSLNNYTVWSFAITGNSVFAGTQNGGIYLSSNNGANWIQSGMNNYTVNSLLASGNNIFAGTANGVFISSNNGSNWTQTALNNRYVNSLVVSGNSIFAGTDSLGVYLSTNNGLSWTQTVLNNQFVNSLAVSGNNIFAGIGRYPAGLGSVYLSTNNGSSWIEKNQGFNVIPIVTRLLTTNNFIFAGTYGLSVWRRDLSELFGIKQISEMVPGSFSLSQNYPNPFNPLTKIRFEVPRADFVTVKIFDVLGREITALVNEQLQPGTYEVEWNAGDNPSGVHYYTIRTTAFSQTKKMVLIK